MKVNHRELISDLNGSLGKGNVSTTDMVAVVHAILGLVNDLQERMQASMETNRGEGIKNVDTVRGDLMAIERKIEQVRVSIADTEGNLKDSDTKIVRDIFEELQRIEASIPTIPEFPPFPSFDPLIERIEKAEEATKKVATSVRAVEKKIPVVPEPKEVTPVEVRDKLESLNGEERLDASAIKNLPKAVKTVTSSMGVGAGGISGIMAGTNIAVDANPYTPMVTLDITVSSTAPSNPVVNELWIEIP